ncbi:MAG: hypothetical protein Q9M50_08470 [Methylococcales bacterium]|nr:hypothetical protein [Methylococcales bacterium]
MKSLITPLIVSVLVIASPATVYANSYSEDKLNEVIAVDDADCNDEVNIREFTQTKNQYDQNKDGYITANEVRTELVENLGETVTELKKHNISENNINKTVTSELKGINKKSAAIIKKMDTDKDGLVEPEELENFQEKQFGNLDRNRDGVISKSDKKTKKSISKGGFGFRYNR